MPYSNIVSLFHYKGAMMRTARHKLQGKTDSILQYYNSQYWTQLGFSQEDMIEANIYEVQLLVAWEFSFKIGLKGGWVCVISS